MFQRDLELPESYCLLDLDYNVDNPGNSWYHPRNPFRPTKSILLCEELVIDLERWKSFLPPRATEFLYGD